MSFKATLLTTLALILIILIGYEVSFPPKTEEISNVKEEEPPNNSKLTKTQEEVDIQTTIKEEPLPLLPTQSNQKKTKVFGRFESGIFPAQIKLLHRTIKGYETQDEEKVVNSLDGSFLFSEVKPGEKIINAYWKTSSSIYFAEKYFSLKEEEEKNLGNIFPKQGNVVQFIVELKDNKENPIDSFLLYNSPLKTVVSMMTKGSLGDIKDITHLLLDVEIGNPYFLHGLPSGKLWLRASPRPDWPEPVSKTPFEIEEEKEDAEIQIPQLSAESISLPIKVIFSSKMQERKIIILFPNGVEPCRLKIFLRDKAGRVTRISHNQKESEEKVSVNVFPEVYEVLTVSEIGFPNNEKTNSSVFGKAILNRTEAIVQLQQGAAIKGRCLTQEGNPVPLKVLQFSFGKWAINPDRDNKVWVYKTLTDEEGRFEISGVIPGIKLLEYHGSIIQPIQPGETKEIEIILQDKD
jgi:hypothetical protein